MPLTDSVVLAVESAAPDSAASARDTTMESPAICFFISRLISKGPRRREPSGLRLHLLLGLPFANNDAVGRARIGEGGHDRQILVLGRRPTRRVLRLNGEGAAAADVQDKTALTTRDAPAAYGLDLRPRWRRGQHRRRDGHPEPQTPSRHPALLQKR